MKAQNNKWYVYSTETHGWVEVEGKKLSVPSWKGFELFYHAPLRKSMLSSPYFVLSEARTGSVIAEANFLPDLKKKAKEVMEHHGRKKVMSRMKFGEMEHGLSPRYVKSVKKNPMTTEDMKLAALGRHYWYQYVTLNGYAMEPKKKGLEKLSKNLDLNIPHLRKAINKYLEA